MATATPGATNSWIEVDVTAAVTGNALISFAGLPGSGASHYSSKEGLHPPELVITSS